MSKIRKALTFVAALALFALLMPISALAATPTTIEVGSSAEFDNAVDTVNAATSGEYIIKLTNDLEGVSADFANTCPATILGNNHTMTLSQYSSISVQSGAHLSLGAADGSDTLKISGGNAQNNDVPGLLYIQGTCNMHPGVTIADRKGNNYFGGGVTVQGGTFHMYGGTIDNCGITGGSMCYGGGVAVIYGGAFTMDGGEIKNCFATSSFKASENGMDSRIITSAGGGVYVSGGSSFVMTGGTISNNKANEMGGGVAIVASIDEIINGGWGNLQSSAQILGGTISGNKANDGAGVLSSAYFYAAAYGLCADTPNVGVADKPGLFLKNATITDNTANQDEGYGAGVLAVMMKSPAAAEIRGCTITNNSTAVGGGVASYGNFTSLTIDGCTITGNKATNYGGGFAAESNSGEGAGTTITNTKLCNNSADKAASDVYLNDSVAKLSTAKGMNEKYLGEQPDDATNQIIDGWYLDDETSRYTAQLKSDRNEYKNYESIESTGEVCLIAANNPTLAKVTFTNYDGSVISEKNYAVGTKAGQIAVPTTPTKPSDDTYDYYFDSWSPTVGDVTGDVVYKAQFNKVFKKFSAKYTFSSASSDEQLPSEVLALLPKDPRSYAYNETISAIAPSRTTVEVADGTWTFTGYDRDSAIADMTTADSEGNVTFAGSWKFVEKSDDPSAPDNSNQPGNGDDKPQTSPNGKSETEQKVDSTLSNTGDGTSVGFCYILLTAAMVALGSAVYANYRIRRGRNQ